MRSKTVLISGAGVAGPTLAWWLCRAGFEPTLVERAPALRTGGYVIDFWGVGYDVARRMGIEAKVLDAGYRVHALRLVDRHGRRVASLDLDGFRRAAGERFSSLPRGDLAAAIHEALAGRVETRFDDGIAALGEHAAGVRVTFERGGERQFDLVVGADGLHSNVRRLAFGPEARFEKRLGYRVAACDLPGYRPRDELVYVAYTLPGRQVARFSLRGDRTLVLFVFRADRAGGEALTDLADRKALLGRIFGDAGWECPQILDAVRAVDDLYFDDMSQIRMEAWSKGRVALIGDAAACVSLLAGEGTGLGMTEAYVLAGELKRAGGDYREAFPRMEQLLRAFIEGKQRAAESFASTFAPRTAFGVWCRNQVVRVMRFQLLADLFIRRTLLDTFALPDYGF